ncbi:MAG: TIM barrel protein [Muricoprocola sp.]
MKITINFSISEDDIMRYRDSSDLRSFYQKFGCSGLEVMPLESDRCQLIATDMAVGVHACCITDWMDLDQEELLKHYWKDLDYARDMHAEYVVFHVTQVSYAESLTYEMKHTNEEVIDAAADFINRLLDRQHYQFYFLMENLWWPGLTFEDPSLTHRLLDRVHYKKKGLMLDTGHFMNTNINLKTPEEALAYLNQMLDAHEDLIPMIKGIHLNQSLSGNYIRDYMDHKEVPSTDPSKLAEQAFLHIFRTDLHQPFTAPGVDKLVKRIDPLFVTLEYISRNREEHSLFLKEGIAALLMNCKTDM